MFGSCRHGGAEGETKGRAMGTVRRATPDDWRDVRLVRLSALADSPSAFGSNLEAEEGFSETVWRQWAGSGPVFLALVKGSAVGMVAALAGDSLEERRLVALWVHPDHRAGGIASTLVAQVEDWARQDGAERLTLWVAQNNEPALSLYRLRGFKDTGKRKDLPSNPGIKEQQMLLRLQ
jgi:ribosomal protein S18 acetylase RimI-like enzyme